MVAAARRAAGHLALSNTQFDVAFPDDLPFPADTFDAVVSRFGVMFFPFPVNAVRRDVESSQARTETGPGGLASRRRKSFSPHAVASYRTVSSESASVRCIA